MGAIADYVRAVRGEYATGEATEHSYRPALKALLESLRSDISATNEPQHRTDCGAPDMSVAQGKGAPAIPVGYVECKDIGAKLDEIEASEQLERYRGNLDNLILTDYLEFRWYVEGDLRATARLARTGREEKLVAERGGGEEVEELVGEFLSQAPEPIGKPRDLAVRLAKLTHMIRDIIVQAFASGKASDSLTDLHEAFKKTLLPELPADEFADMFAQTLSYGLFAGLAGRD